MSDEEYGDLNQDNINTPEPSKAKFNVGNLKKQRGTIKGRLTLFEKYINKFQDVTLNKAQIAEISLRMQSAVEFYKQFNSV